MARFRTISARALPWAPQRLGAQPHDPSPRNYDHRTGHGISACCGDGEFVTTQYGVDVQAIGGELLGARSVEFVGPKFERSKSKAWEPSGLKTWRLPFMASR
jgi:hypothetical protein